jgi:protein TonB
MAFEAFRDQARPGATRERRLMLVAAAGLHGALIALGVVYSYWHVDELTPPTLRVTFISAAPPPPPPPAPPPAGGSGAKKKVAFKPKTPTPVVEQPKPQIVQPRETAAPVKKKTFRQHDDEEDEDDEPAGVKGGVKGGVAGGVIGGTVGGTIGGTPGGVIGGVVGGTVAPPLPPAPKILPPNVGAAQRDNCGRPDFPASLRRAGSSYLIGAKICVSRSGVVETVTIIKHGDSLLEESVVTFEKHCRYKPFVVGSTTAPFCYVQPFEFKGE